MNKRNLIYIIIFVLLGAIAAYFVWKEKKSTAVASDQAFAVQNPDELEKIIMSAPDGRMVTLVRDGKRWKLNDSMYAMPVKVDFLLGTLKSLTVMTPASDKVKERLRGDLLRRSVKIQLFNDKNDPATQTYYVGDMLQSKLGNYMAVESEGKMMEPYVVGITGFQGDISVRFLLNPADLRDLGIFDYKIDDIKSVTVRYPYHPHNSFKLTAPATVEPLPLSAEDTIYAEDAVKEAQLKTKKGNLSQPRVNDYLNSFQFVNAEAFENDFVKKQEVLRTRPVARITVEDKSGEIDSITIYLMPTNKHTKKEISTGENTSVAFDADRYFAVFNDGQDFGIVQQFVFGRLLRSRHDFYIYE